jgi:hypothetical protein
MVPLSESFGARESKNQTIYWDGGTGLTVYNVRRFATNGQASRFYRYYSSVEPYPESTENSFAAKSADEYRLGCGYSEFGGFRCHLDARYEEFVVALNATIDSEMTIDRFVSLVSFIDDTMGGLLREADPDVPE